MQIEHTILAIKSMVLFPGAGLLAIHGGDAHLFHPGHLSKLPFVNEPEVRVLFDCCGNTRLAALLLWEDLTHEARLYQRRETRGGIRLRLVERLQLPSAIWQRIAFLSPDGDYLVVVGEETLPVPISTRDRSRKIDLQISSKHSGLPAARVLAVPGRDAILVAYGDGSLEHIDLASGERGILLDGPEGLDPLVGFACRGESPRHPGPTLESVAPPCIGPPPDGESRRRKRRNPYLTRPDDIPILGTGY